MKRNRFEVTAYLNPATYSKLKAYQERHNLSSISRAVEELLLKGLEAAQGKSDQQTKLEGLEERLRALEKRIEPPGMHPLLRDRLLAQGTDASDAIVEAKIETDARGISYLERQKNWLTTSQAWEEAVRRGWQGSKVTFRRRLEAGRVPGELSELGLFADYSYRATNIKDPTLRWLRFIT